MYSMLRIARPVSTTRGSAGEGYHQRKQARDRQDFLLFVAPAVLFFSFMLLWPLLNVFYLSLMGWEGLLKPKTLVGLANFARLINDRHFQRALVNTAIFMLVSMPGVMLPSFVLGFFLSQRPFAYRLLRTVLFAPAMVSATAMAMMFVGVYLPDGIINTLLRAAGMNSWTRVWLGDAATVLGAIIAIDFYAGTGYYAVLFSAALTGVPTDLYESALLDGAGRWTIMWRIAFPLVLDFFGVASILHFMWILLGSSQYVLLLTAGGPGDRSLTLGYYLYELAFGANRLGYSQAVAVVIFVIGVTSMLLIRRVTRRMY